MILKSRLTRQVSLAAGLELIFVLVIQRLIWKTKALNCPQRNLLINVCIKEDCGFFSHHIHRTHF